MKLEWKSLVSAVAPTLAAALGGPLAGVAVRQLSQAVLGNELATEAELQTALASASPETLAKIKQADLDFAVRMKELDIDIDRISQADRSNARDREVKLGDWTPRALGAIVVIAAFSGEWWAMTHVVPPGAEIIVGRVLGTLDSALMMVLAYYYGSSAGSKAKTDVLAGAIESQK